MEKKIMNSRFRHEGAGNLFKKMKLLAAFFFAGLLSVSASTYSQQTKLSLKVDEVTVKEAFKQIEEKSEFVFFYNEDYIDVNRKVSINVTDEKVESILNELFKGTENTYKIYDRQIVILSPEMKEMPPIMKSETLSEQKKTISGKVTDTSGASLPGVSVVVKGTTIGSVTDATGKFTLSVPTDTKTLVFSFVGMKTQEVTLGGKNLFEIILEEETVGVDEVVIVAFGTQKKTDIVGSVTSIKMSDLKVPSSNLTTALAGRVAGVISYQRSGEPGQDNADFFIRGVTTFGYKTSPLILIDGMELTTTDLARLQPEDISSFSIMKDATSTAVYGARGANGVILVTTKQGKVGKAILSFRVENSISRPTTNVELADPVTYMKMGNEAILTRNPLGVTLYSDEKIANTVPGSNSVVFPANDWKKIMFKDYTMVQRLNLNLSGGGGVAKYYVSGSYNKDNGIMKVDKQNNFNNNIDFKSYTLRSNVTIDVTKSTEMIVRLSGNFDDYQGPIDGGTAMYKKVMQSNPVLFPAYYQIDEEHKFVNHIMFGNYDAGQYVNPYEDMTKGYKDYSRSLMLAQIELKQNMSFLTKGLSFRTMINTNRNSYFDVSRYYNPFNYSLAGYDLRAGTYSINEITDASDTEYLGYSEGTKTLSSTFYMESMFNYNRTFNEKHSLSGLLVYMVRSNINANAGSLQQSLPFRNLGLSGRATYGYDKRYFAEFNFGYNGSERFHSSKRYGFFPSAGLSWVISNEKFFAPVKPVVSNLKLRGTYGLIGNDAIGSSGDRFFYLSEVNMNDASKVAYFGTNGISKINGITVTRYANEDITWETSTQKNIALELGLFNKLNIQAEYYTQVRDNILMTRSSIPITMGLSAAQRANVGEASGKGVDLSVDYQTYLQNGLSLTARGNFTYATSKYKAYEEPQYAEAYRSRVGNSLYQTYGYIAERLFVDDADAANSPKQNFGVYGGGDIKYSDVNRDGQITEADQVPIGNPTLPEIVYGFGFSAGYKGFDVSAFFQGLANESFWIDPAATSPFVNYHPSSGDPSPGKTVSNALLQAIADSYWSEDKRDVYAFWPRLSSTISSNNTQKSTWFMRDGTFLRLKQIEIGYTLPKKLQVKLHTSNFRVYVSGTNLLNFSKFRLWDVEMGGNGFGYPIQKVINMGLTMDFN